MENYEKKKTNSGKKKSYSLYQFGLSFFNILKLNG